MRGSNMQMLEQFSAWMVSKEFLILVIGLFIGFGLSRWRIERTKPQTLEKLSQAQMHLAQDFYTLRRQVGTFNTMLKEFSKYFDDFRQEIEQIDNDRHVNDILEGARKDILKLKSEEPHS